MAWLVLMAALAVWVAHRLDGFDLWSMAATTSGEQLRVPAGYATVDHPFHAVRAETLRRALVDGDLLRWIGHHQGGYPVEFYPLGEAGLEVAIWAAALGALPMIAVHKLVVIGIFLAPMLAFALAAHFDRRSLGVALIASAAHLCVRGWWWSGGSMELVEWGLVTNVASATALVIALPLCVRYLERGSRQAGVSAVLLSAFALLTNPRSGIALATVLAGCAVAAVIGSGRSRQALTRVVARAGLVLCPALLLAAPELVSLIRFSDLYTFVHYSGYENLAAYRDSSIQAAGGPVFVFGIAGWLMAWAPGVRAAHRAVAASLAFYVGGTALLVAAGAAGTSAIAQLETTRLMPFQRLLWILLAAFAVEWALKRIGQSVRKRSAIIVEIGLGAATAILILLYVVAPPAAIPVGDRGLVDVRSSAEPGIVDLEGAVRAADGAAAPGTALLVVGTTLSWHDGLWAPLWSERPLFYDDWLWYWQTWHYGDYNPLIEHAYPRDAAALRPDYLERHGIGAIVVTGPAKPDAVSAAHLTQIRAGTWDVYLVNAPTTIVTFDSSAPLASSIGNGHITATGTSSGGNLVVRRNWFPRWAATVNGEAAAIARRDDGYMSIAVTAPGATTLELTYRADWVDWLGRLAALVGLAALLAFTWPRARPSRRLARRSASAGHAAAPPRSPSPSPPGNEPERPEFDRLSPDRHNPG